MTESSKNAAIGIVVSLGVALVVWVLLFLHPQFGDEGTELHVRFTNIEKIATGSRITYSGTPVGRVLEIRPLTLGERLQGTDHDPFYTYMVTLGIDSHVVLYNCDEITLGTSGLMGERYIAINPKRPPPNAFLLLSGDTVNAVDDTSMADTFADISNLAAKTEDTIDQLAGILKDNRQEFRDTLQSLHTLISQTSDANLALSLKTNSEQLGRAIAAAETTFNEVHDAQIIAKLATSAEHLESITKSLNQPEKYSKIIDHIANTSSQLDACIPKVTGAIDNIASASVAFVSLGQKTEGMIDAIGQKEGSLGKLVYNNDFYFKTIAIMNKLDTMMNDVNNYGVLFHLDKGWQRDRRQRIAELTNLKDPQEFKKYLNDEMVKVSSSLTRLGMAVEKAKDVEAEGTTEEFTRTFSDLLCQLEDLKGTLKEYSTLIAEEQ